MVLNWKEFFVFRPEKTCRINKCSQKHVNETHVITISHIDCSLVHWVPNFECFQKFLQEQSKHDISRDDNPETRNTCLIKGGKLNKNDGTPECLPQQSIANLRKYFNHWGDVQTMHIMLVKLGDSKKG